MSKSDTDMKDLVVRAVKEIHEKKEDGDCFNVTIKTRELKALKDRLYHQLKGVGPRIARKLVN
jgi:hypothetical protein